MSNLIGIYRGKYPVLEIRRGKIPIWKSPGWQTPVTKLGLAFTVNLPTAGDIRKLPNNGVLQKSSATVPTQYSIYDDKFNPTTLTVAGTTYQNFAMTTIDASEKHVIFSSNDATDPRNNPYGATELYKYDEDGNLTPDRLSTSGYTFYNPDQILVTNEGNIFIRSNSADIVNTGPNRANSLYMLLAGKTTLTTVGALQTIYAVGIYDNEIYAVVKNANVWSLSKYDSTGNLLINSPLTGAVLPTTINQFSDFRIANAVSDAAGNMFFMYYTRAGSVSISWNVAKVSTGGFATTVNIGDFLSIDSSSRLDWTLDIDKYGNVYGSGNTGTSKISAFKISNDMTLQWKMGTYSTSQIPSVDGEPFNHFLLMMGCFMFNEN
ncbi:hypothetical protein [Lacticaseibacillus saniviri]|uniref:hypothetical protein n=1 Tax=Lacticaseibacillus saniviri TaxID=931533 RepID=UPI0006D10380|nr:hypothetical protein [Lacticaseibacillus saniviri]